MSRVWLRPFLEPSTAPCALPTPASAGSHRCYLLGWTQGSPRVHPAPHPQTPHPTPRTILSAAKFFLQGHPTVLQLVQLVLDGIHLPIDIFLRDVLICLHLPNHKAETSITTNLQSPGVTQRLVNTNGGGGTTEHST